MALGKWLQIQTASERFARETGYCISRTKKVIFVNGCFWHRHDCAYFMWPATNKKFWQKKIGDTVARDQRNYSELKEMGWDYLVVWECETKNPSFTFSEKIITFLKSDN